MDFAPALFKHPARTRAARGRPARDEIGSARARASREEPTARMASVAMSRLWCTDAVAVSTDMTVSKWLLFVFRRLGLPKREKTPSVHRGKKPQNHSGMSGGGFDVYLLDQSNGSL
jgi:hypothetical protein